jgi:hypothetical protein
VYLDDWCNEATLVHAGHLTNESGIFEFYIDSVPYYFTLASGTLVYDDHGTIRSVDTWSNNSLNCHYQPPRMSGSMSNDPQPNSTYTAFQAYLPQAAWCTPGSSSDPDPYVTPATLYTSIPPSSQSLYIPPAEREVDAPSLGLVGSSNRGKMACSLFSLTQPPLSPTPDARPSHSSEPLNEPQQGQYWTVGTQFLRQDTKPIQEALHPPNKKDLRCPHCHRVFRRPRALRVRIVHSMVVQDAHLPCYSGPP